MIAVAAGRIVKAQLPPETAKLWGSPVIDCHFHPRPTLEANLAHLNGSGCQAAYMLARLTAVDDAKRFMAQGECVARETLAVLKANTTPKLFRTLVWENGHRIYKLKTTTMVSVLDRDDVGSTDKVAVELFLSEVAV
jgi:hypothetical protein